MPGFLGVPVGAALAIGLFTAGVRLAICPLSLRALRAQGALTRLAPQVRDLQRRHRDKPERLSRELTALYRREGTSPLSGLWPVLAQWPVLSVLYLVLFGLLGALCWGSARLAARSRPEQPGPTGAAAVVTRVAPFLTVVVAAFAPLAGVLYLLVTVAWTGAERHWFLRRGDRLETSGRATPRAPAAAP